MYSTTVQFKIKAPVKFVNKKKKPEKLKNPTLHLNPF